MQSSGSHKSKFKKWQLSEGEDCSRIHSWKKFWCRVLEKKSKFFACGRLLGCFTPYFVAIQYFFSIFLTLVIYAYCSCLCEREYDFYISFWVALFYALSYLFLVDQLPCFPGHSFWFCFTKHRKGLPGQPLC